MVVTARAGEVLEELFTEKFAALPVPLVEAARAGAVLEELFTEKFAAWPVPPVAAAKAGALLEGLLTVKVAALPVPVVLAKMAFPPPLVQEYNASLDPEVWMESALPPPLVAACKAGELFEGLLMVKVPAGPVPVELPRMAFPPPLVQE